jgi:hypothetical protein
MTMQGPCGPTPSSDLCLHIFCALLRQPRRPSQPPGHLPASAWPIY